MERYYDTIIGASTRKEWPAWCMTLDSSAPDGPRAAVEAIVSGEDKQHKIVLFLSSDWLVLIGELRFDCGRSAFEAAQQLCARLWREGRCSTTPCQGGFAYKFMGVVNERVR